MKTLELLIVLVLGTQAADHYFLDSTVHEQSSKTAYVYNSDFKVTSETRFQWDTTLAAWKQFGRYQYEYKNSEKSESIYYRWDTTTAAWKEIRRSLYTHTENPKTYTYVTQDWDTSTSAWINKNKTWQRYTSFDKTEEKIKSTWDTTQSIWIKSEKENTTFNDREDAIGLVVYKNSSTNGQEEWEESRKYLYDKRYDDVENSITSVFNTWSYSKDEWEPSSKSTFLYDSQNRPVSYERSEYQKSDSSWDKSGITYYAYDEQGNVEKEIRAGWDETAHSWDTTLIEEYLFDVAVPLENIHQPKFGDVTAKLIRKKSQVKSNSGEWSEVIFDGCFYSTEIAAVLHTSENSSRSGLFTVTSDNIRFNHTFSPKSSGYISNLKGQQIMSFSTSFTSLDVSLLSQGAYVLTIVDGDEIMRRRFLKR